MLVITRGRNDRVIFPTLGISVEILRISGNQIRLGIEAPRDIPILRHEIAPNGDHGEPRPNSMPSGHAMRNRLHAAALGLHTLHRKLESGDVEDAELTIFKIFNELKAIESSVVPPFGARLPEADPNRPWRTLIVEDNENENELLAGYLRLSGFDVTSAMDGLQAMVHLTRDERPDVVLLDMRMPRLDGRKTVSAIRGNPDYGGLKIFAVTGTDQEECGVELGPRGVDRWFTKPVNPHDLVEAIHQELAIEIISV